jgi:hypothetical protein
MSLLLRDILRENVERRLNLMAIQALVEKVVTEVSTDKTAKLIEMFTVLSVQVSAMNAIPYTVFNIRDWQYTVGGVQATLHVLREEVLALPMEHECVRALANALDDSLLTH